MTTLTPGCQRLLHSIPDALDLRLGDPALTGHACTVVGVIKVALTDGQEDDDLALLAGLIDDASDVTRRIRA